MLIEEIVKGTAINENNYKKGKALFEGNNISGFNYNSIPNTNISLFFGSVYDPETNKTHIVSMDLRNKKINYHKCSCNHSDDIFCPHLIAFCFLVNQKINTANNLKDEQIVDNLIKSISKADKNFNIDFKNDLKPIITVNNNSIELELKIGNKKYYTVKNIATLLNDIDNKSTTLYGKSTSINHDINNFNKKSIDLYKYLSSLKKMYGGFTSKYSLGTYKYLKLVEYDIDNLFDSLKKYSIDFIFNGEEYSLKYINNFKFIRFNLNKTELSINKFEDVFFCENKNRLYIFTYEGYSYLELNQNNEFIYNIIKTLRESNGSIVFKESKGQVLYQKIIPILKSYFDVRIEDNEIYKFKEFSANSYLDLEDGIITCKLDMLYDDKLYEEYEKDSFLRDTYKENVLKNLFLEYGFNFKNGYYYINLEKIVYEFKSFLNQLKELSEVYITDYLKDVDKKIVRNLSLSMSVHFNSNLLEVKFDNNLTKEDITNILFNYRKKKKYYALNENQIIDLESEEIKKLDELYDDLQLDYNELEYKYYTNSTKLLLLNQYKTDFKISYSAECLEFFNKLKNYKNLDYPINERFTDVLKPFQKEGYNFLKLLTEYNFGGILADEMGLGKTIQALSLIDNDFYEMPSLIVCPTSLIYNWESEINKFCPNINCVVITGLQTTRRHLISNLKNKDLGIISYETLRMDFEKFKDVKFRFVILDEAQNIKNFKAQKSLAAKSLNSMIRFALTGTPIENYLSDLWSIFDFILPGYLKEYNEFKNDYEKVIMDEIDKTRGQRLIKKVTPFILRRTKKEVLKDLPEKYESIYYAKMDEEQEKIYNAYHIDIINKLKDNNDYINILQGITKLRQICADPNLILEDYHAGSTKLEMCVEIVKQYLSNNRKILIFSTFSSMLNNLMIRLNKEGINTLKLTGETKVKERLELVNLFNDSNKFNVFLISLKAGGVGLNLTSSDCVIHYDPWWNIQAENQATDRSHRIGQTKNVEVIKLICKNTIEEKIIKLQESKKELSDLILENNEIKKEGLTNKDLLELLE